MSCVDCEMVFTVFTDHGWTHEPPVPEQVAATSLEQEGMLYQLGWRMAVVHELFQPWKSGRGWFMSEHIWTRWNETGR